MKPKHEEPIEPKVTQGIPYVPETDRTNDADRLNALQAKPENERSEAEKDELVRLIQRRDSGGSSTPDPQVK